MTGTNTSYGLVLVVLIVFCHFHTVDPVLADCFALNYELVGDNSCMSAGVSKPANTLEGAMLKFYCKSLLIRTPTGIDYCPIKVCQSNGTWSNAKLSCSNLECFNSSSQLYIGRRTCTSTGKTCQYWNNQQPQAHNYTQAADFPDSSVTSAKNYCRDPKGSRGQPWCYTTDPQVEFEFCDVPSCSSISQDQGVCTGNYCGDPDSHITGDNLCTSLHPIGVYDRHVGALIFLNCTSMLLGFTSAINYCPVRRCGNDFLWTSGSVSCAQNECYNASQSHQYRGRRTCTQSGYSCQRWDSQTPNSHPYTTANYFPDSTVSAAGAYCRDPNNSGQPWCYTTNPNVTYEPCGIRQCSTGDLEMDNFVRVESDVTGYTTNTSFPDRNAISCGRYCGRDSLCALFAFEKESNICTLFNENPMDMTIIICSAIRCYVRT
ncbi:hypothetical protein ACJMK2_034312 [Sinanodonta woodiana]|uniref:Plasminogen-like n=1 Tax=Sinanodonta woodiana TaxID=1069815 RepID=A0ABD3WR58_SINWO